jgi:formylmethanofuran dehydrogenase subunit E
VQTPIFAMCMSKKELPEPYVISVERKCYKCGELLWLDSRMANDVLVCVCTDCVVVMLKES